MNRSLKLGTALTLSLALTIPAVPMAQSAEGNTLCVPLPEDSNRGQLKKFVEEAELPVCGIADDPEVRAALEAAGIELPPMAGDGDAAASEEPAAEAEAEAEAEVGDEPAAEAEAEAEVGEEPEPEAEAEAEVGEEPAAEAEAQVGEEPAAEAEAEVADEPAAEAEAEAEVTEEPAAEAEAEVVEEPAAEAEAEVGEEPAAEAEAEVTEEPAAEAEAEAEVTEEPAAEAEAEVVEEPAAEAEAEVQATEEVLPEIDQEAADAREAERRTLREERQAEREARRAERRAERAAAEALTATDPSVEPEAGAQVETEVVTEETSRSSDESFAELATESRAARGSRDRDDTLKAILGAAAAAAVIGAILDNGDKVVEKSDDRVIVLRDGEYVVLKDENTLLRRPGSQVSTETFDDGSTRTFVSRDDGSRIMTIRDADGVVLYRSRIAADGTEVVLIDDRQPAEPVDFDALPTRAEAPVIDYSAEADAAALRRAMRYQNLRLDRAYTLQQVREVKELRELMPQVDLDSITFDTGSAAIRPEQARSLIALGRAMTEMIEEDPDELFLVEGHTDSVGSELSNLALSDRRAESVALALSEYFDVPPENLIVQGYGEQFLKVDLEGDIRANRRATVRRITPLLRSASLQ